MRTFGFVQDAGRIEKLRKVVEIFRNDTNTNLDLREARIPKLISIENGRESFIEQLSQENIAISYRDLVGSHATPRNESECNGIIQATIEGQRREFIGDWPAENYLRWAVSFGFVDYKEESDTFRLSEGGASLINTSVDSEEETQILTKALLAYPPVVRILSLLSGGEIKTKFEIGSELGFVDEPGFTSYPQNVFVKALARANDVEEKRKVRSDWEGTSDKYVRMICGWIGTGNFTWVDRISGHQVSVSAGDATYTEEIAHAYQITGAGLSALRRATGSSTRNRLARRVYWEMLASKGRGVAYLRTKRAHILQSIRAEKDVNQIKEYLARRSFDVTTSTIIDDLVGLKNLGLIITENQGRYRIEDDIVGLNIPSLPSAETQRDSITQLIDETRELLTCIPHRYLSLIEHSFDRNSSLIFEARTIELLTSEVGFEGSHLGGTNRPDGIAFKNEGSTTLGIIIDNKAYAEGFNIPAAERDKMQRYVTENRDRPSGHINSWWNLFPDGIEEYNFLFVSSNFGGAFADQLERIHSNTQVKGAAVTARNLLLLADGVKAGNISFDQVKTHTSSLSEISV